MSKHKGVYAHGVIDLYELVPNAGDSVLIINNGQQFELRTASWVPPEAVLSEEEMLGLANGEIALH